MNIIKNSNADFNSMILAAKSNLPEASDCEFNQCVVVKTVSGNLLIHKIAVKSVEELVSEQCRIVSQMERSSDTEVEKIICMWGSKELDTPSRRFMRSLCELNGRNSNACIMLNSGESLRIAGIGDIIGKR